MGRDERERESESMREIVRKLYLVAFGQQHTLSTTFERGSARGYVKIPFYMRQIPFGAFFVVVVWRGWALRAGRGKIELK